jgi:hypothetical protein
MKLNNTRVFHQKTAKLAEESYELPPLIAKAKKGHTTGHTLVKLRLTIAANIVFGAEGQKNL